jgi:hypothetical protein
MVVGAVRRLGVVVLGVAAAGVMIREISQVKLEE